MPSYTYTFTASYSKVYITFGAAIGISSTYTGRGTVVNYTTSSGAVCLTMFEINNVEAGDTIRNNASGAHVDNVTGVFFN